jgi:hypothetical protein
VHSRRAVVKHAEVIWIVHARSRVQTRPFLMVG